MNGVGDRRRCIPHVCPQADDGPNPFAHKLPYARVVRQSSPAAAARSPIANLGPASRAGRRNGAIQPVAALILLPPRSAAANTATGWLEAGQELIAERHRETLEHLGAAASIVRQPLDGRSFGQRMRELVGEITAPRLGRRTGLIVLGGGSMPLAGPADLAAFLATARSDSAAALANNAYSADAIAVSDARLLLNVPDLPSDNALPRWLAEHAGVPVGDLRDRPWLSFDVDSPIDLLLLGRHQGCPADLATLAVEVGDANPEVAGALAGVAGTLLDRRAELVVSGRTSSSALAWLERNTVCRVRALVEERGLKASAALALGKHGTDPNRELAADPPAARADARQRPPRSVLGMALDARGPGALGAILAELGDAAVVDTRVLLAHRLGAHDSHWPKLADRLASDLLRPGDIADAWLRDLTTAALGAPIPVLLGGHTLVGPGLTLLGG